MNLILSIAQVVGVLAVLVGVVLVLPLGYAVLVNGVLLVLLATGLEWLLARTRKAAS